MTRKEMIRRARYLRECAGRLGPQFSLEFRGDNGARNVAGLMNMLEPDDYTDSWGGEFMSWADGLKRIEPGIEYDLYCYIHRRTCGMMDCELWDNLALNIGTDTEPGYYALTGQKKSYYAFTGQEKHYIDFSDTTGSQVGLIK